MIRSILILTINDLALAYKNKTLYLILFIPVFVFVVFQLVDGSEPAIQQSNIGLIENANYPPAMLEALQSNERVFSLSWLPNEAEGQIWLRERKGDGILLPSGNTGEDCALVVVAKASPQTLAIVDSVTGLQRAMEGKSGSWIAEIRPLEDSGIQRQMLPTWILVLVLMVGFIVLPAQVAEEKEKKLLLGLLQTPIREVEWLLAKLCLGTILIVLAALLLHLLTTFGFDLKGGLSYLALLIAGAFCFTAFGIFVGFLCRTQATARTLGVLFYLPHLLPSALADFSKTLNGLAPLLPSYQFYRPIKSILLEGGDLSDFPLELLALLAVGFLATFLSYLLMKRRWLM
jgi:ABC-2 type transport system permease protein